jgi:hypothetical protein
MGETGERDYFTDPMTVEELEGHKSYHQMLEYGTNFQGVCDAFRNTDKAYPGPGDLYDAACEEEYSGHQKCLSSAVKAVYFLGGVDVWNDIDANPPRYITDTFDADRVQEIGEELGHLSPADSYLGND